MKKFSSKFLLVIGLVMTLGLITNVSAADNKLKFPKNKGAVSIKTEPQSYPVFIDGVQVGSTGTNTPNVFFLEPGIHKVEIQGPNGMTWTKEVNVVKYIQECICLKMLETNTKRPCPYDIRVDAPSAVQEGDLVTFATWNAVRQPRDTSTSDNNSSNSSSVGKSVAGGMVSNRNGNTARDVAIGAGAVAGTAAALNYVWRVSPDNAKITSGIGTNSITVDTSNLGGQTVVAELDVTDGLYDASCRQRVVAQTSVSRIPQPVQPTSSRCDEFISRSFDDDKARFDNCVISLQNAPDAQLYIFIYQGTAKRSSDANKLARRTLDYLVKSRGIPPQRVTIIQGGTSNRTGYEMWIVPPGASLPTPIANKAF